MTIKRTIKVVLMVVAAALLFISLVSANCRAPATAWNNTYTPPSWTHSFNRISIMIDEPLMWFNDVLVPVETANPGVVPVLEDGVLKLPLGTIQTIFGIDNTTHLAVEPVLINEIAYLPVVPVMEELNVESTSISWHKDNNIMVIITGENIAASEVVWRELRNQSAGWYGSERSINYANNLLVMQRNNGGWPRGTGQGAANVGTAGSDHYPSILNFNQASINYHLEKKDEIDSYFGRGITTFDIRYMIMMYEATKIPAYRESYMRGLRAILNAQYPCGGWPYYVTDKTMYRGLITFSDEATTRLMELLTDILNGVFPSVTNSTASDAISFAAFKDSYDRGLKSILNLQVWSEEQKMLTAWAQAYNAPDLMTHWAQDFLNFPGSTRSNRQPAWQREFEPPAIGGDESTRLILFLMNIPNPGEEVQNAIHSAIAFFEHAAIRGIRRNTGGPMEFGSGNNRVLLNDPNGVVWPRFMDINTFQPLFSDRRNPTFNDTARPGEREAHISRPGIMFESPGGQLRNIYIDNQGNRISAVLTGGTAVEHPAELDLINSYANMSFERRNGYHFMGAWPLERILGAPYDNWLEKNGLSAK
ncbi:MAG: hypothetical protein LBC80_06220 [Treponema sp.]|jgi:pectinesterase|nr:hypothetical protein [Treponema sp.]